MAALDDAVRKELFSRLEHFALAPRCVLALGDVGARALKRRFPSAEVIEIVAEDSPAPRFGWWRPVRRLRALGATLPIADAHADLALARFGALALGDFEASLAELRRVLAPGGLLLFAVSAEDPQAVGSATARTGFVEPVLDVERFRGASTHESPSTIVFGAAFGGAARSDVAARSGAATFDAAGNEVVVPLSRLRRRPNSLS
jgi:malonyl-CoA O-methyltransferase